MVAQTVPRLVEHVHIDGAAYTINVLTRQDPEQVRVLAPLSDAEREATVLRWLALGSAIDQRASAVLDADYIGRETDRLLSGVRTFLDSELRRRFDPNVEDSLTRPVLDQARDSQRLVGEARTHLEELIKTNFDPNDARSAVAKISVLLQGLENRLSLRFDPERKDSVLGQFDVRFDAMLSKLGGPNGPFRVIAQELQALRTDIARAEEARNTRGELLERSSAKGGMFEDQLEHALSQLARAHGDIVERTSTRSTVGGSKKGDFVIKLARDMGTIAIEAKSGSISSVPKLLRELSDVQRNRSSDLAIAVIRDAEQMPAQMRPFQFYDEGVVVASSHLEFAYRVARWLVAAQNEELPASIDPAVARDAIDAIIATTKRLRPARQQLTTIEKAAEALRALLEEFEKEILQATQQLDESLDDS